MTIRSVVAVCAAAALALGVASQSAVASSSSPSAVATPPATSSVAAVHLHTHLVTTFPTGADGSFAESMAIAPDGTLYVAVTTWSASGWNAGQVYKVTPSGRRTTFGPTITGGLITGLAFDPAGRLYVGLASWQETGLPAIDPGVFRIDPNGTATRVLTLPTGVFGKAAFPNGLAVHGRYLYVADSVGAIWRTRLNSRHPVTATRPWLRSGVLAATAGHFGINGIAFRGDVLYGVVYDSGLVVKVPLTRSGAPGRIVVLAKDTRLTTADGITFDATGRLWVTATRAATVGTGALLTVDRRGRVSVVVEKPAWLDYPTQVAFGRTPRDHHVLYLTNGAFASGKAPTVIAIEFGGHHH